MSRLKMPSDPRVIVGMETDDDAGVFLLEGTDQVLVQTVDFITPVCDDPYWFGRVAAANSLSDIYAMGGRPITALNICCLPQKGPGLEQYAEILRGGLEVITEAGAVLLGGQSVKDEEIKYGLAVTGVAHRDRITPNSGARPGDRLILTKPIGTGVLIGGSKSKEIRDDVLMDAVRKMATLNREAAEVAAEFGCKGATDVTGFGLAGHAWEMAAASGVRIVIDAQRVPVYDAAKTLLQAKIKAGKIRADVKPAHGNISFAEEVAPVAQHLCTDPQTSGGLLIAIPSAKAEELVRALKARGVDDAVVIGEVESATEPAVVIR